MLVPPILFFATAVTALPFQNATTPEKVGWTSGPQVRGTFDLLLSCLTTLFLCAWTAYHPNVVTNTGEWRKLAKRVLWMGIAVLVPEVVLWCAWEQWWTSRRLVQVVDALGQKAFDGVGGDVVAWGDEGNTQEDCMGCRVSGQGRGSGDYGLERLFSETSTGYERPSTAIEDLQKTSPSKLGRSYMPRFRFRKNKANNKQDTEVPQKTPIWTKEEAFFALSGGYAVSSSSFHPSSHLTLTPTALIFLARLGLLPNTPRMTISDKSKADYVAKILVCIQAGWFLLQCVARLAKGLPLTLLELHVLAHVGCTFVMYVLWIEKPYDVGAPVLVEDERVRDLVAFWAVDDGSASSEPEHVGDKYECAIDAMISLEQVQTAHRNAQAHSTSRSRYGSMIKNYMRNNLEEIRIFGNTKRINSERDAPEPATSKQLTHLAYANAALSYLKSRQTHFTYVSKNPPMSTCSSTSSSTSNHNPLRTPAIRLPVPHVVPVRSNLLIDGLPSIRRDDLRGTQVTKAAETYAILSALYGGLHLAGWGFKFTSEIERWCWRSSGLAMVAAPLGTVMIVWSLSAHEWTYRTLRKRGPAPSVCKSDGGEGDDGASMTPQLPSSTHARPPHPSKSTSFLTHLNVFFGRACRHILSTAISFIMYPSLMAAGLGWTLYPFARLYVLVEVFAALRASDPDVYKTVEWADWIPHFG